MICHPACPMVPDCPECPYRTHIEGQGDLLDLIGEDES